MFTKSHHKINKLIEYLLTAFYVPRLDSLYELINLFPITVLQNRDDYYPYVKGEEK